MLPQPGFLLGGQHGRCGIRERVQVEQAGRGALRAQARSLPRRVRLQESTAGLVDPVEQGAAADLARLPGLDLARDLGQHLTDLLQPVLGRAGDARRRAGLEAFRLGDLTQQRSGHAIHRDLQAPTGELAEEALPLLDAQANRLGLAVQGHQGEEQTRTLEVEGSGVLEESRQLLFRRQDLESWRGAGHRDRGRGLEGRPPRATRPARVRCRTARSARTTRTAWDRWRPTGGCRRATRPTGDRRWPTGSRRRTTGTAGAGRWPTGGCRRATRAARATGNS